MRDAYDAAVASCSDCGGARVPAMCYYDKTGGDAGPWTLTDVSEGVGPLTEFRDILSEQ